MLRSVMGSGMIALLPVVRAATPIEDAVKPTKIANIPMKPAPIPASELPIYDAPHAEYREYLESQAYQEKTSFLREALQTPIKTVRVQVQSVLQQTGAVKHSVEDNYSEFADRTDWIVKYLREEENKEIRYGAVAMGGLTGFILGLRGGIIRRLLYTGISTTVMGGVCFPDETRELVSSNGSVVKQYINIAYNFLYGVKPGDPQLEIHLPDLKLPKSFSEFVDMGVSIGSTIKQAVSPPPRKDEVEAKSEKKE